MENKALALMLEYQHHLERTENWGYFYVSRHIAERYSLIEWLEFEKLFIKRATELGYVVIIESDPASYRTKISWERPRET